MKMLCIVNSEQRDSGTGTDFSYSIKDIAINDINKFRINKITIPYSFYNIRTQTFHISQNEGPLIYLTFPGGNYTAQTLITELTNLINASLVGAVLIITYNSITNKFTFVIDNGDVDIDFLDSNMNGVLFNYNLGYQMGTSTYMNPINTPVITTTAWTAPYVANLNATYNLYLSSPTFNLYNISLFNRKKANVCQSIPIAVNSYNFIIWENQLETIFDLDNNYLNQFTFQLLDDYANVIDLNGLGIIIELEFSKY